MSYVYVACKGEFGEGHSPVSVHAELLHALAAYQDEIGDRPMLKRPDGYLVELDGCDELWFRRFSISTEAPPNVVSKRDDELTVEDAAALLNVAPGTVKNWATLGRIPSRLVPRADGRGRGMRLVKRSDVEAYRSGRER